MGRRPVPGRGQRCAYRASVASFGAVADGLQTSAGDVLNGFVDDRQQAGPRLFSSVPAPEIGSGFFKFVEEGVEDGFELRLQAANVGHALPLDLGPARGKGQSGFVHRGRRVRPILRYPQPMAKRGYFLHTPDGKGPLSHALLVLWHGAGGDVDHPTIVGTARGFAKRGGHAVRARFPYRVQGRNAPDRMPKLLESARDLLAKLTHNRPLSDKALILGGRSMGGRMTSMLAAEGFACDGLMLMSYPLHPVGQKDKLRDGHLPDVSCPMLFLQGAKDNMADLSLLRPVIKKLGARATLEVFENGDHGMKKIEPAKVVDAALEWAQQVDRKR